MIRNALTRSRAPKEDAVIELSEMDNPGESSQDVFETREGVEMVPGTVHLVDSKSQCSQETSSVMDLDSCLGNPLPAQC
jgi:hypothetical protein